MPETTLQTIETDDIGHFAAEAFEHPDDYMGRQSKGGTWFMTNHHTSRRWM
ncbi:hypothetical protein [Streptomyces sp. WM6378]|uniref:hypothetical protein n=1 Tax=Streptomyces sp. WM6378 TaxID=1415557 RepID=UPI001F449783|nr:hypothetical protein [Streptomyces sp. WM6378]